MNGTALFHRDGEPLIICSSGQRWAATLSFSESMEKWLCDCHHSSIPWEATNDGRAVDQINRNTKSSNSFTFFLECNSDIWREKFNLFKSEKWDYCGSNNHLYAKNPCYSVYHHKDCGPVFGYRPCFDYDGDLAAHILVGNDCDKNLNSRIDSFIGEHLSVRKHMTDSFFVTDYEVFQVSQV